MGSSDPLKAARYDGHIGISSETLVTRATNRSRSGLDSASDVLMGILFPIMSCLSHA